MYFTFLLGTFVFPGVLSMARSSWLSGFSAANFVLFLNVATLEKSCLIIELKVMIWLTNKRKLVWNTEQIDHCYEEFITIFSTLVFCLNLFLGKKHNCLHAKPMKKIIEDAELEKHLPKKTVNSGGKPSIYPPRPSSEVASIASSAEQTTDPICDKWTST